MSRSGRSFGMERGRLGGPHLGGGGQVPYLPPGMFLPHMADGGSHRIVSRCGFELHCTCPTVLNSEVAS